MIFSREFRSWTKNFWVMSEICYQSIVGMSKMTFRNQKVHTFSSSVCIDKQYEIFHTSDATCTNFSTEISVNFCPWLGDSHVSGCYCSVCCTHFRRNTNWSWDWFYSLSSRDDIDTFDVYISRSLKRWVYKLLMMMIAFITIKSSLVPLIEGLCVQIYFRFEISVVCSHLLLFFFVKEKTC